jgi:hypothetical protein
VRTNAASIQQKLKEGKIIAAKVSCVTEDITILSTKYTQNKEQSPRKR